MDFSSRSKYQGSLVEQVEYYVVVLVDIHKVVSESGALPL